MMKGSPKDYKMIACRGHSDYITDILCINQRIASM